MQTPRDDRTGSGRSAADALIRQTLTNTNSLQDAVPDLELHLAVIETQTAYVSPPRGDSAVKTKGQ